MPDPKQYKTFDAFMNACIPIVMKEKQGMKGPEAYAKCRGMWENKKQKGKKSYEHET
jgi:hypothetical protein